MNGIKTLRDRLRELKTSYWGSYEDLLEEFRKIAEKHPEWIIRSIKDKKHPISLYAYLNDSHRFYLRDIVEKNIGQRYHVSLVSALINCIGEMENQEEAIQQQADTQKQIFFEKLRHPSDALKEVLDLSKLQNNRFLEFIVANPSLLFTINNNRTDDILPYPIEWKEWMNNSSITSIRFEDALWYSSGSICLLYELGRLLRNAEMFHLQPRIYLSTPQLSPNIGKDIKTLESVYKYRQKLYKELNIETDLLDTNEFYIGNKRYDLTDIRQKTQDLTERTKYLLDRISSLENVGNDKHNILTVLDTLGKGTHKESGYPPELAFIASPQDVGLMRSLYEHYDSLDFKIIYYTLVLQHAGQIDKNCILITDEKALLRTNEIAIFLDDFKYEKERNKINQIIEQIDVGQLSIQMSDLLSFCHYFFRNNDDFWTDFYALLDKLDNGECTETWKMYKNDTLLLNDFRTKFLTIWYEESYVPYFIYPYMYAVKAELNDSFAKQLKDVFSKLIIHVLTHLNTMIGR